MQIPMKWLKEYVDIDLDINEFCDRMTMSGTKVERVEYLGEEVQNVVVGKILEIENHPDADKLVVTKVDVGEEIIQIVTGADNIKVNDYVPIALVGALLPGDIKIKSGKLRGVESNGMMCSVEELGFSREDFEDAPEHGIYIFPKQMDLGISVKPYFGLDDAVVEYEITSNRPDCFSILGIAREVAATLKKSLKYPEMHFSAEAAGNLSEYASVEIQEPELCARYMGRIINNVKIQPSPRWMQTKLIKAGLRPINNIVDITNYIMLEMGQPMHAFDVETLEDKKIIVRNAKEGEELISLDGETRKLYPSNLVIADGKKPIAIAGIIGGENTKITEKTTAILFESANFDGTSVRLSTKKLGLRTDAAAKYVKYLDPNNVEMAMNRACHLIELIGAGHILNGTLDEYPVKRERNIIEYNPKSINRLLGIEVSEDDMVSTFSRLECEVDALKKIVVAPTFRPDLAIEADLAEEVARFFGYDLIPTTLATGTPTIGQKNDKQKIEDMTKVVLESCSISEALIYSFESPKVFDKLLLPEGHPLRSSIEIINPLGEDFSMMRTQSINGMLNVLATNYSYRNEDVKLYEIGKVYTPKSLPLTELPDESWKVTIGMYGHVDYYDMKGAVETLIEHFNFLDKISYSAEVDAPYLHPGRKAEILINDVKSLGYIGEIHPTVLENYGIEERAYIAVLDLALIVKHTNMLHDYTSVPRYPAVNRDIAFLVKDEIMVQDIQKVLKQRGGKLLESYNLFDIYKGEQIKEGHKSIAYKLIFRAGDHTLTEKEITKAMSKIMQGLEMELNAELRK